MTMQVNEAGMFHCSLFTISTKSFFPQLLFRESLSKVIHRLRPKAAGNKVVEDLPENIRKLEISSLVRGYAHEPLSFVQREFFSTLVRLCPIQVLDVWIGIPFPTNVFTKKVPLMQVNAQFFFDLADHSLFRRLTFFEMAAEKIPMIRKKYLRFVIPKVDQ